MEQKLVSYRNPIGETIEQIQEGVMGRYLRPLIVHAVKETNNNNEAISTDLNYLINEKTRVVNDVKQLENTFTIHKNTANAATSKMRKNDANIGYENDKDKITSAKIAELNRKTDSFVATTNNLIKRDETLSDDITDLLKDNNKTKKDIADFIDFANGQNVVETGYFRKAYVSDSRKGICRNTTIKGYSCINLLKPDKTKEIKIGKSFDNRIVNIQLRRPVRKDTDLTLFFRLNYANRSALNLKMFFFDKNGNPTQYIDIFGGANRLLGEYAINTNEYYNKPKVDIYAIALYVDQGPYDADEAMILQDLMLIEGIYKTHDFDHDIFFDGIRHVGDTEILEINSNNAVLMNSKDVINRKNINVAIGQYIDQIYFEDPNYYDKRSISRTVKTYKLPVVLLCDTDYMLYVVGSDKSKKIQYQSGWVHNGVVIKDQEYIRVYIRKKDDTEILETDDCKLKICIGKGSSKNPINNSVYIRMPNAYGMPGIVQNGERNISDHLCDSIIQELSTGKIHYVHRIKKFTIDSSYDWEIYQPWSDDSMLFFKCKTINSISPFNHKFLTDELLTPIEYTDANIRYAIDNQLPIIVQSQNKWGAGVEFGILMKRSVLSEPTVAGLKTFFRDRYNITVYAKRNSVIIQELTDPTTSEYTQNIDPISYDDGTLITTTGVIKPNVNLKMPKDVQTMLTKDMTITNKVSTQHDELSNSIESIETRLHDNTKLRQLQNESVNNRILQLERR